MKWVATALFYVAGVVDVLAGGETLRQAATGTGLDEGGGGSLLLVIGLTLAVIGVLSFTKMKSIDSQRAEAQRRLAAHAQRLAQGARDQWRSTGVAEIDAVAKTLDDFHELSRGRRDSLEAVGEFWTTAALTDEASCAHNVLRGMIDAMPIGVVLAQAPDGRIVEGNRAIEEMLRHPVVHSGKASSGDSWRAKHADGGVVESVQYPLARALAGEARPTLECLYERPDGTSLWVNIVAAPVRDSKGEIIGAIVAVTDIDELKRAKDDRRKMSMELHHRVNNSLAMIQGIANITARKAKNFASFRNDFSNRVQCLSRLSTLLTRNSWEETGLRELIDVALITDEGEAFSERMSIVGEDVALRSEVALALGMALHELVINAVRFGALSRAEGRVAINWRVAGEKSDLVRLDWIESGGPAAIESPQSAGVGLYLLQSVLGPQIGGDIKLTFTPEGLRATLAARLAQPCETRCAEL